MVSFHKPIAELVPGMMSLSLAGSSMNLAKKSLKGKAKPGDFIMGSMDALVGIPLIGATANSVALLWIL